MVSYDMYHKKYAIPRFTQNALLREHMSRKLGFNPSDPYKLAVRLGEKLLPLFYQEVFSINFYGTSFREIMYRDTLYANLSDIKTVNTSLYVNCIDMFVLMDVSIQAARLNLFRVMSDAETFILLAPSDKVIQSFKSVI